MRNVSGAEQRINCRSDFIFYEHKLSTYWGGEDRRKTFDIYRRQFLTIVFFPDDRLLHLSPHLQLLQQQICALSSKSFPSLADCSLLEYWPDSRFFFFTSLCFPSGLIYIYARSN